MIKLLYVHKHTHTHTQIFSIFSLSREFDLGGGSGLLFMGKYFNWSTPVYTVIIYYYWIRA